MGTCLGGEEKVTVPGGNRKLTGPNTANVAEDSPLARAQPNVLNPESGLRAEE